MDCDLDGGALPHASLTLQDFESLALEWRNKAADGDPTTRLIADAFDSVVRRRIAKKRRCASRMFAAFGKCWKAVSEGFIVKTPFVGRNADVNS